MSKRGLPASVQMRHDYHYVEELSRANRPIGKVIEISRIAPNPEQPRVEFGDLTELTESIREKGVLEPLLVKPNKDGTYMIIAGERRWRSSQLAGLTEVPCIELDLDENTIAEIALIENLQRKDLTVWEEADGLAALGSKFGYTHDEIAKKISKSRSTVTELMTIAGLPQQIRERCRELNLGSKASLLEVARQFDDAAMIEYLDNFDEIKKKKETVKKNGASPGISSNGSAVATKPAREPKSVFRHRPEGAAFTVEVKFDEASEFSKRAVLQALKQVFEDLKNEDPEVS